MENFEGGLRLTIFPGEGVIIDGSAMVKLISGNATVMGYQLKTGMETLICCSSVFSPSLIIEPTKKSTSIFSPPPTKSMQGRLVKKDQRVNGGVSHGKAFENINGKEDATILELRSYSPNKDGKAKKEGEGEGESGNWTFSFTQEPRKSFKNFFDPSKQIEKRGREFFSESSPKRTRFQGAETNQKLGYKSNKNETDTTKKASQEDSDDISDEGNTESEEEGVSEEGGAEIEGSPFSSKKRIDGSENENENENENGNENGKDAGKKRRKVESINTGEEEGGEDEKRERGETSDKISDKISDKSFDDKTEKSSEGFPKGIVIPEDWKDAAKTIEFSNLTNIREKMGSEKMAFGKKGFKSSDGSMRDENTIQGPPIVVICGSKNVGKSTFSQYLVNTLLNRYSEVGFLETDVGQPELTVAGCLSLHILSKPVFASSQWHLQTPHKCFFFGDTSPKSDPEAYLRCFVELYDYFRTTFYATVPNNDLKKRIPLVINTHGWIRGIGLDVLVDLIRYAVPSYVVHVAGSTTNKGLPPGAFWEAPNGSNGGGGSATKVLRINGLDGNSEERRIGRKSPGEARGLRLLAFLQRTLGSEKKFPSAPPSKMTKTETLSAVLNSTAISLMEHRPFQVPISAIQIIHLHNEVPPSHSFYAINGAIVGLAISPPSPLSPLSHMSRASLGGPLPHCVGLGLIRSVDLELGVFYVLTDVDMESLQNVNLFLHGRIELPSTLLQAKGLTSPYICQHTLTAEGTGSVAIRSRGNLLRRAQEG